MRSPAPSSWPAGVSAPGTASPPHTATPPALPGRTGPAPAAGFPHRAALAACTLLIVLGLAWELWLAPTGRGTLALKVLPLAAAWPGLLQRRLYTYRWTSLLVWLYCAEGATRAATESGAAALLAVLQLLLGVALFAACAAYVRLRLRAAPVDAATRHG
jgi:uncharacterized membrane protein